jgi:outer membrane biosynthesis protein TonB
VTAVKWIVVAIFSLAALGALGMGFTSGSVGRPAELDTQPALALRAFPSGSVSAGAAPAAAKPGDAKPAEVADAKPAEAKPAEVADAKPAEPKPAEAKPAEVAAKPPPAENKPPPAENKPPPAENKPPAVAENKPPPAAAGTPPAAAAKPPAPAAAEGLLNLRASDTADVYLDGKKLGGSPLLGVKARAGNHKVRFDCYDAAGNTVAGPVQVVSVKADGEVDVEFTCPAE